MSRQLETTLTEAAAKNLSAAVTLEWLADMEIEARSLRAIERRFRCSRLQAQPSIDAFHFHHHKSRMQAKPRLLRLLDLSFLPKGTNIVLIGNPGVGKTFLATSSRQLPTGCFRAKPTMNTTHCRLASPLLSTGHDYRTE